MHAKIKHSILERLWSGATRRYIADSPVVVVVAGSVGKTSTKEAIATLLQTAEVQVVKTQGNLATDFGVPLSLLGYSDTPVGWFGWARALFKARKSYKTRQADAPTPVYVLEYSSDSPGDTAFLTQKIPPHIVVLATLVPVHMMQYGSVDAMVTETLSVIDALPEDGVIIANADDAHQVSALTSERIGSRHILWYSVSESQNADAAKPGVTLVSGILEETGKNATVRYASTDKDGVKKPSLPSKDTTIHTKVIAAYQLYPLAAAVAVGLQRNLASEAMVRGLEAYELPAGRGRLIPGKNEVTIIDDSANASPDAVKAGLSMVNELAGEERRKVVILGTMNELGDTAEAAHIEIGAAAAEVADYFVALGEYAQKMLMSAHKKGMLNEQMIGFPTPERLRDNLHQVIQRGDLVYIKASQNGMRLERIVKALMADPKQAETLLVRQGRYWR